MKRIFLLFFIGLMLIGMIGCSSNDKAVRDEWTSEVEVSSEETKAVDSTSKGEEMSDGSAGLNKDSTGTETSIKTNRKVIQNSYFTLETEGFINTVNRIKGNTYKYDGYFEQIEQSGYETNRSEDDQNRWAFFKIRIPIEFYESFVSDFDEIGVITENRLNSEDVTDAYFDTEARVKTLLLQEERILNILEKATEIEDVLKLENELTDLRYRIESLTGTIKKYDNLTRYTTININVHEKSKVIIVDRKPQTFSEKITTTFKASLRNMMKFLEGIVLILVALIPHLIYLLPITFVILYMFRKGLIPEKPKSDKLD